MNIGLFKRPKLATVLTTIYFTGVLLSACVLYLLQFDTSKEAVLQTYRIVGVTMFCGIIALYYTARARRERVVYLERKKDRTREDKKVDTDVRSWLNMDAIDEIISTRKDVPQRIINEVCKQLFAGQGAIYLMDDRAIELKYGYALTKRKDAAVAFELGEGLVGRVAAEGQPLYIDKLPQGYLTVYSGLGSSTPSHLALVPIMAGEKVKGVMEVATFSPLNVNTLQHLEVTGKALGASVI